MSYRVALHFKNSGRLWAYYFFEDFTLVVKLSLRVFNTSEDSSLTIVVTIRRDPIGCQSNVS
jgi:hypothetical protein